jgi:nitronate monooxygenase
MKVITPLSRLFGIDLPVIMAPMFLVSNEAMMQSALQGGILGCFPSLNYRKDEDLRSVLKRLNEFRQLHHCRGHVGVNLIVQKTNQKYMSHLEICAENKVPFYITSLGNPTEVIRIAHAYGAKVFCDVTNLAHAEKSATLGCDGFIAVTQGAGGHAGPYSASVLIPALKKNYPGIPVIAAGGISTGDGILSALALGAAGVSIGTRFIASTEATVSDEYKNAIVTAGMSDIVMTERLSGTPCAVINTDYVKKIGTHQNSLEKWMNKNPRTKKYFKMLVQVRGMKQLEDAVKPGNYKNIWCAGQSAELVNDIRPCMEIIQELKSGLTESKMHLDTQFLNSDETA